MERFGPAHLAILLATALAVALAAALGRLLRGRAAEAPLRRCLAYAILGAMVADPFVHEGRGELTLAKALPLQLCDAAAAVTAFALFARRRLAFELSYFWGLAGVTQALVTPPALPAPDDPDTWRYAIVHAATLAGAAWLAGLGHRPRRGSWGTTSLVTIAYTLVVGAVDWALGANYMWLREAPDGSVLDLFGPWPFYILGGAVLGAFLFYVLELPWRAGEGGAGGGGAAPGAP